MSQPVVIVVRDPDYNNEFHTFAGTGEPIMYDVDLGRVDLDDAEELQEWEESHTETIKQIPVDHPARECYEEIVANIVEEHSR